MPAAEHCTATSQNIIARLQDARRQSDALFRLVRAECLYHRPIPERHRIIFYVGHLEAFDWNLLREAIGRKSFHPEWDRLFAFGIDPVEGGLPRDLPSDWPPFGAVQNYANKIRAGLEEGLANGASAFLSTAHQGFSMDTLLNVAVEHRLMHVETLAYMLHQLPFDSKEQPREQPTEQPSAPHHLDAGTVLHRAMEIPAGSATLGLPRGPESGASESFSWDNEYEAHTLDVPAFSIDRYKVTNRQFLDFISAGGYHTRAFWSDDDWNWRTSSEISHPLFWNKSGDAWMYRTMFANVALPLDWPVYVSQAEASAYARWAGKSLPTEAEWHRAAYGAADGSESNYPWGNVAPTSHLGNFNYFRWDPTSVHAFPDGRSAFGVCDLLGNGWEWTSTAFAPFQGFQPFPFYRGYSADFFDGKHFVLKGGSPRTAACLLRRTFRNWFQAHYQYAYAGFRCVTH